MASFPDLFLALFFFKGEYLSLGKLFSFAILAAAILSLMLTNEAWATAPYQPVEAVELMTSVTAEDAPGINPADLRFKVGPVQTNADHSHYVAFFDIESGISNGQLNFQPGGKVSWEGKGAGIKGYHSENFLLMPGLSLPVDVFPVSQLRLLSKPAEYAFQRQAGGRTFVDRIQVSMHPVTSAQAREAKWIRVEETIPDELTMIEAVDSQTGLLVAKQLWAPGSDWWLYEETPFRRSWRIQ